jgi:hypothetical protein
MMPPVVASSKPNAPAARVSNRSFVDEGEEPWDIGNISLTKAFNAQTNRETSKLATGKHKVHSFYKIIWRATFIMTYNCVQNY